MNKIAVDKRLSDKCKQKLISLGYTLIEIPQNNIFDDPISAHPDMFITRINYTVFVDKTLNNLFTNITEKVSINREAVEYSNKLKYPYDIEFNCVQVGSNLICNRKYTNEQILLYAKNEAKLNIINVNQGYTKCSVCVVSDKAIITEDDSIFKEATKSGIDVLKIEKGYIKLPGYDYGFIGGCSGLIENNLLVFAGNIETHPQSKEILEFCKLHNVNVLSLSDEDLYDVGTIYRIQ